MSDALLWILIVTWFGYGLALLLRAVHQLREERKIADVDETIQYTYFEPNEARDLVRLRELQNEYDARKVKKTIVYEVPETDIIESKNVVEFMNNVNRILIEGGFDATRPITTRYDAVRHVCVYSQEVFTLNDRTDEAPTGGSGEAE